MKPIFAAGLLMVGFAAAPLLEAQVPAITTAGVVNAASGAAPMGRGQFRDTPLIAVGAIVSIFGRNLAQETIAAQGFPLPEELGGTRVEFDRVPAPLFFVSPWQINARVPLELSSLVGHEMTVITPRGKSYLAFQWVYQQPGIFTADSTGCGQAAALNNSSDGQVSINQPDNSVSPGEVLSLFATGLGPGLHQPQKAGEPAAGSARDLSSVFGARAYLNGREVRVLWAGNAPGMAGVNQVNMAIPVDAADACTARVQLFGGLYGESQEALVSIRRGGGPCVDPPVRRLASLVWERVASTDRPPEEGLRAEFMEAWWLRVPPRRSCSLEREPEPDPDTALCREQYLRRLDAGVLIPRVPAGYNLRIAASSQAGRPVYRAGMPPGTLTRGEFVVESTGGPDIGQFSTRVQIPPPIQVTTQVPPGAIVDATRPLTVQWTGGEAGHRVHLRLVSGTLVVGDCAYPATAGTAAISGILRRGATGPGIWIPRGPYELVMTYEPDDAGVSTFTAAGLSESGRHSWRYVYRFPNLEVR